MKFKETEIKYLAGILDADGCIGLAFKEEGSGQYRVHPTIQLAQGPAGHELIRWLAEMTGVKPRVREDALFWWLQGRKASALADRVIKFMVVKGKALRWVLDVTSRIRVVSSEQKVALQHELARRRRDAGPMKPRNFVGAAWIAGFLDGDGHYSLRRWTHRGKEKVALSVSVSIRKPEKVIAIEFLQKTLGGTIRRNKRGDLIWFLGLGKGHRSRAVPFLRQMRKFTKVKSSKIQAMIEFHKAAAQTKCERSGKSR